MDRCVHEDNDFFNENPRDLKTVMEKLQIWFIYLFNKMSSMTFLNTNTSTT